MKNINRSVRLVEETIYDLVTGRIVGHLSHSGAAKNTEKSRGTIAGKFDPKTQHVDMSTTPHALAQRPDSAIKADRASIVANGADQVTFNGIRNPTALTIDGNPSGTITDGTLEFSATVAGTYRLVFSGFPDLDAVFEIVASP